MKRLLFGILTVAFLHAPALAAAPGSCEVTVSGAVTRSDKAAAGTQSVGTDYWMTDDEIRIGLRTMLSMSKKFVNEAQREAAVDEAMKREPRVFLLIINCDTPSIYVMLGAASGATYKDIPMKPGTYKIGTKKNELSTMLRLKEAHGGFWTAQAGTVHITAFDKAHIAGDFEIEAKHKEQVATWKGSFDYPCKVGKACAK